MSRAAWSNFTREEQSQAWQLFSQDSCFLHLALGSQGYHVPSLKAQARNGTGGPSPSPLTRLPEFLPYSQVHLLPGERVGEVFHPVVAVFGDPGLQRGAERLQDSTELLRDAASCFDLVHLQTRNHRSKTYVTCNM